MPTILQKKYPNKYSQTTGGQFYIIIHYLLFLFLFRLNLREKKPWMLEVYVKNSSCCY